MAHEITATDGLVLTGARAWHGLGTIVETAPTPGEALKIAKLDWQVEQWPVSATDGQTRVALADSFANVRTDTKQPLGIVGRGYRVIQNQELADFAQAIAAQDDIVRVETAGSIRGGERVWFLLRGESFTVRGGNDAVSPYILLSNGHDGQTLLRATPTTVRVVCSNTLHQVIPRAGRAFQTAGYVARHTGDISRKIDEAREALRLYQYALGETRQAIDSLAGKNVDGEAVRRFFLESYTRDFGAIPGSPKNAQEEKARARALKAFVAYDARFQRESATFGASLWLAVNAYSGWLQHDRTVRAANPAARRDQRLNLALFGDDAERTSKAFTAALSA